MANNNYLYPNQVIGIIGESFSNLSLVSAAKKMGFKVALYSKDDESDVAQLSDYNYVGSYADEESLKMFAERCDIVIYNNDQISASVIDYISQYTNVPQQSTLLDINQDRLMERSFFETLNINMVPYSTIINLEDLYQSLNSIGYPAILKPIQKGIAGTRELLIRNQTDVVGASGLLDLGTYILESYVKHDIDYTVVATRSADGNRIIFPVVEDMYDENRLVTSFTPAKINGSLEKEITRITNEIANNLDYVGTFEVSFFVSEGGSIYINKIAPNLGMAGLVFEYALSIGQFEQHLRAVAGLPLSKPIKGIPTVLQAIFKNDYARIKTQWVIKDNWHFSFYGIDSDTSSPIGHILIPTESIPDTLMQLEGTNIWSQVDFKSKYEKMR
ncbi:ATP-grasp domain-containing protein [Lentilactobacillus sp. Marseille-Q4993]|uniref:ATP-grasp domain-containing protein n=1 Tax=Lentilactobacillus sp. Marseille-Q4993 TaxID=3039492 RepID=UPI0024BC5CDD|nr:ATP-grasp domain-containing protein [Lentilactobacillus sp. Marseille-Q4993]